LVLGGAYLVIYTTVRKKLGRIGKERVEAGRQLFQIAGEAFGGIKDVKILGKEQDFIKQFSAPSLLYSNHMATKHIIGILPKYALETVAFGGILLIILYLLVLERDISQVLPLLGLYAVAIYRLMPALQQIFQSVTKIRFHLAALDVLYKDVHYQPGEAPMRHIDRDNIKPLPFRRKLELRDITFRYPGAKAPVFEDFNLTIDANSSVAFVGATGSGKTTTVDIILGLIRPERGRLLVDDAEIGDGNLANWQKNLGYVPQHIYLFDKSVARNIAFGVPEDKIDRAAVERAAKVADIHDFILEMPDGYDTMVGERGVKLSGGQRQRIGIARALYHDPEVLILDEATSALDGVTEENVFAAVDALAGSKTIVMIAHRISTVRNCDVIYLLDRGRVIAQGSYEELLASSPQFRAIAQIAGKPGRRQKERAPA
jgi:ABC-type multidrug transport system fused ATPase/permease subunit